MDAKLQAARKAIVRLSGSLKLSDLDGSPSSLDSIGKFLVDTFDKSQAGSLWKQPTLLIRSIGYYVGSVFASALHFS